MESTFVGIPADGLGWDCAHQLGDLGQSRLTMRAKKLPESCDAELEAFAPDVDLPLDEGIRRAVLILRRSGIETFESCQGGPGHAFPEPTVRFYGNSSEGFRALATAMTFGLPVLALRRVYDIIDGEPVGPWWEMTFRTTDRE